jgi:hypothetical protein
MGMDMLPPSSGSPHGFFTARPGLVDDAKKPPGHDLATAWIDEEESLVDEGLGHVGWGGG